MAKTKVLAEPKRDPRLGRPIWEIKWGKGPAVKYVYQVMWRDTHVVVEGGLPDFGHSIHRTLFGANKEMRRMRVLARKKCNRDSSGKVTSFYQVVKRELLT